MKIIIPMRRYNRRGPHWLGTIALSILVLALSTLVENQGFAAYMTRDAEKSYCYDAR